MQCADAPIEHRRKPTDFFPIALSSHGKAITLKETPSRNLLALENSN